MDSDTCIWSIVVEVVYRHKLWRLRMNKVRRRRTGTQGGAGRIKRLLSDYGEYKQKGSSKLLGPTNRLHTGVEFGVKDEKIEEV